MRFRPQGRRIRSYEKLEFSPVFSSGMYSFGADAMSAQYTSNATPPRTMVCVPSPAAGFAAWTSAQVVGTDTSADAGAATATAARKLSNTARPDRRIGGRVVQEKYEGDASFMRVPF